MTTEEIKAYLEKRLELAKGNRDNAKTKEGVIWYEAQIMEIIDLKRAIR